MVSICSKIKIYQILSCIATITNSWYSIFKKPHALINGEIQYIFTLLFDYCFLFSIGNCSWVSDNCLFLKVKNTKEILKILKRNLTTIYLACFSYIYDVYGSHLNHLSLSRTDKRQSVNCRKRAHNKCLDLASYFEKSRGHLIWLQNFHYKMVCLISLDYHYIILMTQLNFAMFLTFL